MVSASARCRFNRLHVWQLIEHLQAHRFPLELSAPLKPGKDKSGRDKSGITQWLEQIDLSSALMGALLATCHPDLYRAGREAWHALATNPNLVKESDELMGILPRYRSPFTAYSVISNRKTPVHRDNYSRAEWFNLLATVGKYVGGKMRLPGLGITLAYEAGTVVNICGLLIRHGVDEVEGNRVCIAHFMREKVHQRLNVNPPSWVRRATL